MSKVDTTEALAKVLVVYKYIYVIAMMGTLFWASAQEMTGAEPAVNVPDKLAHFLVYGLLATLILRTHHCNKRGMQGMFFAIGAASLYGVTDEWHQYYVPGRFADAYDWFADTLGALLAAVLYRKWNLYRKILECRLFRFKTPRNTKGENAGSDSRKKNKGVEG